MYEDKYPLEIHEGVHAFSDSWRTVVQRVMSLSVFHIHVSPVADQHARDGHAQLTLQFACLALEEASYLRVCGDYKTFFFSSYLGSPEKWVERKKERDYKK